MSSLKWLVALCVVVISFLALAQSQDEKVLRFYWQQARSFVTSGSPDFQGLSYSFIGTTLYKKYAERGKIASTDSSRSLYFFSYGKLDSTRTLLASKTTIPRIDLGFPEIFDSGYLLNFFPNDTGGTTIAIGFDSDSTHSTWPVGFVLLDRQRYFPHWIFLSYPAKKGYRRYSRSLRFIEKDGFIFPDSVSEVATIDGLFFSTSYRLETGIRSLTIYRK